ncbi:MAG: hypothetical protein MSA90_14650 [Faecalicatena sp.]|uniref:hypothetical protein n=1 Tax=Faecalicatena sp. TaxID=2005360 RepID=UPI002584107C|nr:hypothetical protein [Faecalicatena sp.]MCI6466690.1 hypothetical protein [Faecalicatena sp.]MDY5620664.1 hypothetical protein [Lachnospiraceae bacterium]
MKKKCRAWMALSLVLSMMVGMQVQAEEPKEEAQISMTAFEGTDLNQVKAGDTVKFHISMSNTTEDDLSGARLVVTAKSTDGQPAGDVVIPEEGNSANLGDRANGNMKGITSAVVIDFRPSTNISDAVVSVKVAEDMAGKPVEVNAFLSVDNGEPEKPTVSNFAQTAFTVMEEADVALEPVLTLEAVSDVDFSKGVTKDVPFKITVKLTNSGNIVLHNIQVDTAYSDKTPDFMEEKDFLKLGSIVSKGDFTILDDGSGYLSQLEVGASKELTFECKIPKDYAHEQVNLFLAAGAFEAENLEGDPVAQDMSVLNCKVLAQQPVPTPDSKPTPGIKPNPGTPPKTEPTPEIKPVVKPAKVQPVKKAAKSPQTGDESQMTVWMILMLGAGGTAISVLKKRPDFMNR